MSLLSFATFLVDNVFFFWVLCCSLCPHQTALRIQYTELQMLQENLLFQGMQQQLHCCSLRFPLIYLSQQSVGHLELHGSSQECGGVW